MGGSKLDEHVDTDDLKKHFYNFGLAIIPLTDLQVNNPLPDKYRNELNLNDEQYNILWYHLNILPPKNNSSLGGIEYDHYWNFIILPIYLHYKNHDDETISLALYQKSYQNILLKEQQYKHFKDYLDIISLFITLCKLYNNLSLTEHLKLGDFFNIQKIKEIVNVYDIINEGNSSDSTPGSDLKIMKKEAHEGNEYKPIISDEQYLYYFKKNPEQDKVLSTKQFGSFPTFCHHKLGLSTKVIPLQTMLNFNEGYGEILQALYKNFMEYLTSSILSTYVLLENDKLRIDEYIHYYSSELADEINRLHTFLSNFYEKYDKSDIEKTKNIFNSITNRKSNFAELNDDTKSYLRKFIVFLFNFHENHHKIIHSLKKLSTDNIPDFDTRFSKAFTNSEDPIFRHKIFQSFELLQLVKSEWVNSKFNVEGQARQARLRNGAARHKNGAARHKTKKARHAAEKARQVTNPIENVNAYEKLYDIYNKTKNNGPDGYKQLYLWQFQIDDEDTLISPSPEKFVNAVNRYDVYDYAFDLYMSKFNDKDKIKEYKRIHDEKMEIIKEKQQESSEIVLPLIIPREIKGGKEELYPDFLKEYMKKLCVNIMKSGMNWSFSGDFKPTFTKFKNILCDEDIYRPSEDEHDDVPESEIVPVPGSDGGPPVMLNNFFQESSQVVGDDGNGDKGLPRAAIEEAMEARYPQSRPVADVPMGIMNGGAGDEATPSNDDDIKLMVSAILTCYGVDADNNPIIRNLDEKEKLQGELQKEKQQANEAEDKAQGMVKEAEDKAKMEKDKAVEAAATAEVEKKAALEAVAAEQKECLKIFQINKVLQKKIVEQDLEHTKNIKDLKSETEALLNTQKTTKTKLEHIRTTILTGVDQTGNTEDIITRIKSELMNCKNITDQILKVEPYIKGALQAYVEYIQTLYTGINRYNSSKEFSAEKKLIYINKFLNERFGVLGDLNDNLIKGISELLNVEGDGGGMGGGGYPHDLKLVILNYNHELNGGGDKDFNELLEEIQNRFDKNKNLQDVDSTLVELLNIANQNLQKLTERSTNLEQLEEGYKKKGLQESLGELETEDASSLFDQFKRETKYQGNFSSTSSASPPLTKSAEEAHIKPLEWRRAMKENLERAAATAGKEDEDRPPEHTGGDLKLEV